MNVFERILQYDSLYLLPENRALKVDYHNGPHAGKTEYFGPFEYSTLFGVREDDKDEERIFIRVRAKSLRIVDVTACDNFSPKYYVVDRETKWHTYPDDLANLEMFPKFGESTELLDWKEIK